MNLASCPAIVAQICAGDAERRALAVVRYGVGVESRWDRSGFVS